MELRGYETTPVLRDHMRRARAFLMAALEDFGIITVEAQASGTPVIAYGRGGSAEIVRPDPGAQPTGILFFSQTAESIVAAIEEFERTRSQFTARACRANAERFSAEVFRSRFSARVEESQEKQLGELSSR